MIRQPNTPSHIVALIALILVALFAVSAAPARAGGPVFDTVTNCSSDSDLRTRLTELEGGQGGHLDFNCGTATIALTSPLPTISQTTEIDGGNTITLSGSFGNRLFTVNAGRTFTLKNITLINGYNSDSAGGGAVSNNGHLVLDHVTIHTMPDSAFNGGAIATYGALDITNSNLYDNKSTNGGAIYASGASAIVTISTSTLTNNKASAGNGGAIDLVSGASLDLSSSTVNNNTATSNGGGINTDHSGATVSFVTLSGNHANNGAGITTNVGNVSVTDVTLSGNVASNAGGAILNTAALILTNSTLSSNSASFGGALYNEFDTATLTNVTLAHNSATNSGAGGGIANFGSNAHLSLRNVLIANSTSGGNCELSQLPDVSDHNLSSDDTCDFGNGRNNLKLKLGPLETNGGFTQTHRLQPGSPAIDKGVFVNSILEDQRSVTRPRGSSFDVGAVEFLPCTSTPSAPVMLSPVSQAIVTTPQVVLDWAGPDCVKTFSVTVRRKNSGGTIVFTKSKIKPTQVTTPALSSGKYVWQVIACNGSACKASPWHKFKIQ